MIERYSNIKGAKIRAVDGEMGAVEDVYVDTDNWEIRYFVIDTNRWFPSASVLLSPQSVTRLRDEEDHLVVNVTRDKVKNAPAKELAMPVSRQFEESLYHYYGWHPYWGAPGTLAYPYPTSVIPEDAPLRERIPEEWTARAETSGSGGGLRSLNELKGYRIDATDEEFGRVSDFLIEDRDFKLIDFVVNSHRWLPGGRETLCSPFFIKFINYNERTVAVDLSKQAIVNAPAFNWDEYQQSYHQRLVEHYLDPTAKDTRHSA